MFLQSGHEVILLDEYEMKKYLSNWEGYRDGLVRMMPGKLLYHRRYQELANKFYNFQYKKSDIFIMSWPKCGSTWTQEIVWNMIKNPNLDNTEAAAAPLLIRSPYFENDMLMPETNPEDVAKSDNAQFKAFRETCPGKDALDGIHIQLAECLPEPRIMKTHLPLSLMAPSLLDTSKVIYIARNPKDVIVSFNHNCRIFKYHGYVGSFEDFVQYFIEDGLLYGPYWLHLKEAWEMKENPNLLFLFYEGLKENPLKEMKKIDSFLQTNLTEAQLNGIFHYTSFDEMKARVSTPMFTPTVQGKDIATLDSNIVKKYGGFFRKGEVGDWKHKITPDLEAKIDHWTLKYLDPIGIIFKYEI